MYDFELAVGRSIDSISIKLGEVDGFMQEMEPYTLWDTNRSHRGEGG